MRCCCNKARERAEVPIQRRNPPPTSPACPLGATSFPGSFPWLEGGTQSQGKGPGNEVALGGALRGLG